MGTVENTIGIAEKELLGGCLVEPEKIGEVIRHIRPKDFTSIKSMSLFEVLSERFKKKEPGDYPSVCVSNPELGPFITECFSGASSLQLVKRARLLAAEAKKRRVTSELRKISNSTVGVEHQLNEVMSLYRQEMLIEKKQPGIKQGVARFREHVKANQKRGRIGIPTGFKFFEDIYMQYVPGHLWLVGGFTSVGKTTLLVQKICQLFYQDIDVSVLIISAEMTEEQIIARILANVTGTHYMRILSGKFRPGEEEKYIDALRWLEQKNITIYDDIYALDEIETAFRKAHLQGGVDIGFIDYVQNCKVTGALNSYQESAELAKGLQALAKEVRCTLICMSQVSNAVGRGEIETLEFKGSGDWAAVADVAVMLKRGLKKEGQELILFYLADKNRHGMPTRQVFEFQEHWTSLCHLQDFESWKETN